MGENEENENSRSKKWLGIRVVFAHKLHLSLMCFLFGIFPICTTLIPISVFFALFITLKPSFNRPLDDAVAFSASEHSWHLYKSPSPSSDLEWNSCDVNILHSHFSLSFSFYLLLLFVSPFNLDNMHHVHSNNSEIECNFDIIRNDWKLFTFDCVIYCSIW